MNIDTLLDPELATARSVPLELNATDVGLVPAPAVPTGPGDPLAPTVNTDTLFEPLLATASSVPLGLNATDCGALPVPA